MCSWTLALQFFPPNPEASARRDPSGWCRNDPEGAQFSPSIGRHECECLEFSTDSLEAKCPLIDQRADYRNGQQNNKERNDVKAACHGKDRTVAGSVVQQVSDELSKCDSAHGSAKPD